MSPLIQMALDKAAIPWIDIGISPLRFLPDLAITIKTSKAVSQPSKELALRYRDIVDAQHTIRDLYKREPTTDLDNALVFFAQTEFDPTLIRQGGFAGVTEAVDGLEAVKAGRRQRADHVDRMLANQFRLA